MSRRVSSGPPFTLFAFQDIITSVVGIMLFITLLLMLDLLTRTERAAPAVTTDVTAELQGATAADQQEATELRRRIQSAELVVGLSADELARKLRDLDQVCTMLSQDRERIRTLQQVTDDNAEAARRESQTRAIGPEQLQSVNAQLSSAKAELKKLRQRNRVIYHAAKGVKKRTWLLELEESSVLVAEVGQTKPPQSFSGTNGFTHWLSTRSPQTDGFVLLVKPVSIGAFEQLRDDLRTRGFDLGFDLLSSDQTALDPETGAGSHEP